MATAYVMISCDLGQEKRVIDELKSMIPVKDVEETVGAYDIVAKVESNTVEKVNETIGYKIRKMENVRSTLTLLEAKY